MPDKKCPACEQIFDLTSFEGLPLDERCRNCIPTDVAMALYDKRIQEAGHTMAQILDANDHGVSLKPLERMVSLAYDNWGGANAFMGDVVQWIRDLAITPKGKASALSNAMKLLNLHAKVDRMRLDEDFKRMDDATLRETVKLKLMALFAEASIDDAKKKAKGQLLGGDDPTSENFG